VESQTFILYGSGSRDEMFPFSDLEFAVLTDSDSKHVPPQLVKALEYFEMRITALGETPLGIGQDIPIREGFCFDPGGNAPSSIRSVGTFIGTAEEVAGQIDPTNLILAEVFSSAKCLIGNESRCKKYNEKVNEIFGFKAIPKGPTIGQQYALNNLQDHLQKMQKQGNPITKPDLSNLKSINAKELSRFPVFLASSLCKYHGVSSEVTNTLDRLKALSDLGVLNEDEVKALTAAFECFGKLRLEAEVHHQGQEHTIYKEGIAQEAYSLSANDWQSMLQNLEPLRGIYEKIVQFTADPNSVFTASSN
jgi:signal-transduction protein with cAMP-binding, CBS, and nucleotidyltransferase domain